MNHLARNALTLSCLLSAAAYAAGGWRNDGTNVYASGPTLVSMFPSTHGLWTAKVGSWSNASPVLFGGRVCTTSEPTTIACVETSSGRAAWSAKADVVTALTGAEQAAAQQIVDAAASAEAELATVKRDYSSAQRDARSNPADAALAARASDLAARMGTLKATIDAALPYRTPSDKETIGYASATPATDGALMYTLFGNGVVTAWGSDGSRRWSRWMGPPSGDMRGYAIGTAASPLLVDGMLIFPFNKLTALDAATGAVRWEGADYRDFGTPAVARVNGTSVLATPDGQLVRASDGAVLQTGLGNIWYIGPIASGNELYYAGSTNNGHTNKRENGVVVRAYQLSGSGSGVRASERWAVTLPSTQTMYAQPVLHGGYLYVATHRGEMHTLATENGGLWYTLDLGPYLFGDVFASPIISGGSVAVLGGTGVFQFGTTGPVWSSLGNGHIEENVRATPLIAGDRMYLRTYSGLRALKIP